MRARSGSRLGVAVGEGWANVASSPIRSVLIAVAAGFVAAAVVLLSVSEVAGIEARYRAQVAEGRFVLVARSPSRGGLDAGRCDALRSLPGVRSAGAVLDQSTVYPVAAPMRPYDRLVVTPGLQAVWFPTAQTRLDPGLTVGADAAQELGLARGAVLQHAASSARSQDQLPDRPVTRSQIRGVLPEAARSPESGRMLFEVAAPTGTASACFVDPDPSARSAVEAALVGWFGRDQPASVAPFLEERIAGRLPEAELAARATRWVWLAAALVLVALVTVLWYGRRDEFALYRLLGLRRGAIALSLATEALLTVAIPALVGAAVALVASQPSLQAAMRADGGVPSLAPLAAADVASFALALTLVPLVGVVVVGWRATFDVLKGF